MPYLNLKISGGGPASVAGEGARALTAITAGCLGKKRELTSVLVELMPRAQWFIAGDAAEAGGFGTFYLEVKITSGTNTKDEKARYLREAFDALARLIGNAHPASYVVLHEVPADAWGYGGETQEYRYVKGKAP